MATAFPRHSTTKSTNAEEGSEAKGEPPSGIKSSPCTTRTTRSASVKVKLLEYLACCKGELVVIRGILFPVGFVVATIVAS